MRALWRDIRFGVQSLLRAPGFAAVAVVTLALGVGANSAIFSVVSGTLLNSIPWEDPSTIVSFVERNVRQMEDERGTSTAKYPEWRAQAQSYTDMGAFTWWGFNLTDGGELDFVDAALATPNCFELLGLRLALGRGLVVEDAAPGAERAVILTHGLFQRRYGGDPNVVGRKIAIDGEPATVVGVLDEYTWFPWPWVQMIAPLRFEPNEMSRTDHRLSLTARLRPGVTVEQAQAEMDVIATRLADQYPETDEGWRIEVALTRDRILDGPTRTAIWIMMGAVGFVLLIACANVANLLLARAAARQKEIAIRAALGASRARIVLQLLTESTVLAALAAPFALLVTRWALDYFLAQVHPSVTYMHQFFRFDAPVIGFAFAATFATVLIFGLAPALQASKPDLNTGLKEGGDRGSSHAGRQRLRSSLVVAQIALALSLLVSSGLLIQSFLNVQASDPGFDTENLLLTSLSLPESRYPEPEHWRLFERGVLERLRRLPGVEAASSVNNAPFGFGGWTVDFSVRGRPLTPDDPVPRSQWVQMSPEYLSTLGVDMVKGRALEESDRANAAPVILINETLARQYFPDQKALGQHLVVAANEEEEPREREIVGVVRNITNWQFNEQDSPRIYATFAQAPAEFMNIVVRTAGEPGSLAHAVRREVSAIDPQLPLFTFETMTEREERSRWQSSLFFKVMLILGALSLVLAAVGVYGVVSYSTAQRTREFGIRSALGAEPARIARLVLREAMVLAAIGVSFGLLLAAGFSRLLVTVLYEVDPWSPLTFLLVAAVLTLVALGASAVPAQRATRVDPMVALRTE